MKRTSTATSTFGTSGRVNHNAEVFYKSRMYEELQREEKPYKTASNPFPDYLRDRFIVGSAEHMTIIPDNAVHLAVTSPPYNVSKEYDKDLSLTEYLAMLKRVFQETYRVLVDGGRFCINVANLGRKPYIPLSHHISRLMSEVGFHMRGEIIWDKGSSASPSTAWGSWMSASNPTFRDTHEYILVFSKGSYKRNRTKEEMVSKRNTISREDFMAWTKSVWHFNAVSAKRIGHPAPFPIALPYRFIQLLSFEGDIILDPFMGSGTTAIAALKSNRHYVGFDTSADYISLAEKRIAAFKEQEE